MFSCGRRHTENKGTVMRVIQERCGHAGTSAAKGHREEGLEDTCYVRKAGTLQPEEEKAQEDLLNVCIYLVGMSEEDRAKLFSVVHSDRTSGNGHKIKYREFHLNKRKKEIYSNGQHILEHVAQRGSGVSILAGIQNIPRDSPEQPTLVALALQGMIGLGGPQRSCSISDICGSWFGKVRDLLLCLFKVMPKYVSILKAPSPLN